MSEIPSLSYVKVINALQRAGFIIVRQRGSHIRMQKRTSGRVLKLTIPVHKPIKKSTLVRIVKDANLSLQEFKDLL